MPATTEDSEKKFTGKHMLLVMIGFFGTIISVNLALVYFAEHSWTGLIAKNGFVASQHFNELLEKAEAQKSRGWRSALTTGNDEITVSFHDKEGRALTQLDVSAVAQRPTHEGEDLPLKFVSMGEGRYIYRGAINKGVWVIDVSATQSGEDPYRQIFKVVLK